MANFLRFRRRLQCRCTPQQKKRYKDFDAAVPASAGDDTRWDAANLADAAQFIKMRDMDAPVRSAHRKCDGHPTAQQRGSSGAADDPCFVCPIDSAFLLHL